MLATNELKDLLQGLPPVTIVRFESETLDEVTARRRAAKRERASVTAALEAEWKLWLADEYAAELPLAAQDAVFALAWEQGHHAGYSEVEGLYEEYAEFADKVRSA